MSHDSTVLLMPQNICELIDVTCPSGKINFGVILEHVRDKMQYYE